MTVAAETKGKTKPEEEQPDFRGLILQLLDQHAGNQSDLARAIGVRVGTLNTWIIGTRLPGAENLRKLAEASLYPVEVWQAAVGRKVRAPLNPDREKYLMELWRQLGDSEQSMTLTQIEALARASRNQN